MERALLITASDRSISFFSSVLEDFSCKFVSVVHSCAEARRLLIDCDFDLCIINAPLPDETGERLAESISRAGACQVILCVAAEHYQKVPESIEDSGVLIVARPIAREFFWSVLKVAQATRNKIRSLNAENSLLVRKLEDLRFINRAKCILIERQGMTESGAHRYIEKRAMDSRITKKDVALGIISAHEDNANA